MLHDDLIYKLKACEDFPVPTSLMLRVIDLGRDAEATVAEVESVIKNDPGMVIRLLQVANSPLYGVRQCGKLREALLLIGIDGALSLALAFCVAHMQHEMRSHITQSPLNLNDFWRRSLLSALAGRVMAQIMGRKDGEQIFLASLVQDIGILALCQVQPDIYQQLPQQRDSGNQHALCCAAEQQALATDHAEVSAWLLDHWGLPSQFSSAVTSSHALSEANIARGDAFAFDMCVAFSGAIADMYLLSEFPLSFRATAERMQALLGLDAETLADVLSLICAQLNELEIIFDMPVLDEHLREQKLRQAQAALTMRML